MTKSTKILSLVLSVIMLFGVFSASTPVFAADLAEAAEEKEYRDNLLKAGQSISNYTRFRVLLLRKI